MSLDFHVSKFSHPEEARRIDYDPTWYREKRRQSVEQWKKLVAEGKMPLTPRQ
jgi:hypothetical protein